MYIENRRLGLRVNLLVPIGLVFLLLLNGTLPIAVMLLAALVHEAGHLLFARAVGVRIVRFDVELWGGRMCYAALTSYRRQLFIASGGIIANLLCAPLGLIRVFGIYGRLFCCSCLCYALINLIPARTLDGGEMLRCFLRQRSESPETALAERAVYLFSMLFIAGAGAALCLLSGFNYSVVFIALLSLLLTVTDAVQ